MITECNAPQSLTTVVIATTAESTRKYAIDRAINSCTSQKFFSPQIIIVANGNRYCPEVIRWLKDNPNITYFYRDEGNYPAAIAFGRTKVSTKYFAFLDDDDELIDDSIYLRECFLENNPHVDVVACNGYLELPGGENTLLFNEDISKNDSKALLKDLVYKNRNWLASCGATYRTEKIDVKFFEDYVKHIEWTYYAFKLALFNEVAILMTPGFIYHSSPMSLSKTFACTQGRYHSYNKILVLPLSKADREQVRMQRRHIAHYISVQALGLGSIKLSLNYHLKSLTSFPTFFNYVMYTRHIIFHAAKALIKKTEK